MRSRVSSSCAFLLALVPAVNQARAADAVDEATPSEEPAVKATDVETAQETEEILVAGSRRSFAERAQVTGSRAPRPVSDVPQGVSVVPKAVLESTGARRVEDVAHLVPSVQLGAGFGSVWDDYYVRGSRVWSGTMYRNGYLGGYSNIAATDAVNVERVEVLRGPAAALYGPGLPGGTINIVTKRPEHERSERLTLGFGSFDTQRVTIDATGPLSDKVLYRVTAGFDQTAGYRDFNESERFILNPSFLYELGEDTRWLVESQVFRVRYRPDPGGVPMIDEDPFALPAARSYAEPDTPLTSFDGALVRSEVTHDISSHVTYRLGVQRQVALSDERALYPLGLGEDGRSLARINTHMTLHAEDVAVQSGVELRGKALGMEHDAVVGVDARYEVVDYRLGTSDPGADPFVIDVYDPRYGSGTPQVYEPTGQSSRWTYRDMGIYLNDVMRPVERLRIVAGGRVDKYAQTSVSGPVDVEEGELATSGRLGAIVDTTDFSSVYASVSKGYWPVVGVSGGGALLKPEHSRGVEVGARASLEDDVLTADAAVFRVDNENISVPDPDQPEFQVQRGASRSQGLELSMTANVDERFRAIGSYTLSDAEITEDPNPDLVGKPLVLSSRHSGGIWSELELPALGQIFELGLGARAVGERPLNDGVMVPGYVRVDGSFGLRAHFGRVRLFGSNLANKDYVQSGNDAGSVLRGAPRSFFVSVESAP